MAAPLLLFICTANSCRSPMAEGLAIADAQRVGFDVQVASAGLAALPGYPAATHAIEALAELGLSLGRHRSQPVTRELVDRAALVVTTTDRQRDQLRQFFGADPYKIVSFNELTGLGDVVDPVGGGLDDFRATCDVLRLGMPQILSAVAERVHAEK